VGIVFAGGEERVGTAQPKLGGKARERFDPVDTEEADV
jgi:hypothetical protein